MSSAAAGVERAGLRDGTCLNPGLRARWFQVFEASKARPGLKKSRLCWEGCGAGKRAGFAGLRPWEQGLRAAARWGEKSIFTLWSGVRREVGLGARNWGRGKRKETQDATSGK